MPYLLRTLRKIKFARDEQPHWVPIGEVQADALKELKTGDNVLSVWEIDDERANFERVLTAIAGAQQHLANLDYALLDIRVVHELGIAIVESPGEVPDGSVANEWHRDLVDLTAGKVAELAKLILIHALLERRTMSNVRDMLKRGIEAGHIDPSELTEDVMKKLR